MAFCEQIRTIGFNIGAARATARTPVRKQDRRADLSTLRDAAPLRGAMNRKTLHEFAALHAPDAMRRWRKAYEEHILRALTGEADPTNRDDPGNIVVDAEIEIETELEKVLK